MNDHHAPEGFHALTMFMGFMAANGPLYLRSVERDGAKLAQVGFRVEMRHVNPMKTCHGGMLATFADMVLPIGILHQTPELHGRFLPTINLQLDYLAPAPLGCWVQAEVQVLRVTHAMVFAQTLISADGTPAVRASGIFKIGPTRASLGVVDPLSALPAVAAPPDPAAG